MVRVRVRWCVCVCGGACAVVRVRVRWVASAGSGTILEGLSIGKKMVVVVNNKLMDNHQMEIASVMGQVSAQAALMTRVLWSLTWP